MCGQGMQAFDYLEASKVIYTNGCIDKLVNWIHSNLFLLGGVALGLAIPQVTPWSSWWVSRLCRGLGRPSLGEQSGPSSGSDCFRLCSWWGSCCPRSS